MNSQWSRHCLSTSGAAKCTHTLRVFWRWPGNALALGHLCLHGRVPEGRQRQKKFFRRSWQTANSFWMSSAAPHSKTKWPSLRIIIIRKNLLLRGGEKNFTYLNSVISLVLYGVMIFTSNFFLPSPHFYHYSLCDTQPSPHLSQIPVKPKSFPDKSTPHSGWEVWIHQASLIDTETFPWT